MLKNDLNIQHKVAKHIECKINDHGYFDNKYKANHNMIECLLVTNLPRIADETYDEHIARIKQIAKNIENILDAKYSRIKEKNIDLFLANHLKIKSPNNTFTHT